MLFIKETIYYQGNFGGGTGYSVAATGHCLALNELGYNVIPLPLEGSSIGANSPVAKFTSRKPEGKSIRLVHDLPYRNFADIYYTIFEFDHVPYEWVHILSKSKCMFTASQFSKNAFVNSGIPAEKIFVAWHPIYTNPSPLGETYKISTSEDFKDGNERVSVKKELRDSFKFLSVFEWVTRKRPDILIKAFVDEFDPREDVSLILRTWTSNSNMLAASIKKFAKKDPRVFWLRSHVGDIYKLYRSCDAHVSTNTGEGFGLTMAESMLCGLPTIGPNYGGSLEFMNKENSWLTEMGPLEYIGDRNDNAIFWVRPDMKWRVPNGDAVRAKMREVYETFKDIPKGERFLHPKIDKALKIKDQLSLKNSAEMMKKGLEYYYAS